MYYPFYNNPFYYPSGAYIQNMCSYRHASNYTKNYDLPKTDDPNILNRSNVNNINDNTNETFSINGDRLEIFGISINIDDLIILIILFFLFRESNVDYSIIIILALILFDQC